MRLDLPVRSDNDRLLDAVYDGPVPIDALVEHDGKVGDLGHVVGGSLPDERSFRARSRAERDHWLARL